MYLAVCDDNIADRKQTERLLSRQSDRIFREFGERIYIDSYGNEDAFMANPQMYAGLFIDMVSGDVNGFDIVRILLNDLSIEKPIVMCVSSLDYRKMIADAGITADNVYYLDKPLKVAELTEMVEKIRIQNSKTVPTLELRGKDETIYAHGDEIICVRKLRSELEVMLTENRTFNIIGDLFNLYDQCRIFPQICPVSDNGIVNVNHVVKTSFGKVTMDNGATLPVSFTYRSYIQKTRDNLANNQN